MRKYKKMSWPEKINLCNMERRIPVTRKEVQENISFLIDGKVQQRKFLLKQSGKDSFKENLLMVSNLVAHGDILQGS